MRKRPLKDIIIEGVDRLGKDTLIKNIQHELGFFQEIHYQKPLILGKYVLEIEGVKDGAFVLSPTSETLTGKAIANAAQKRYQEASFRSMFHTLTVGSRHILNRAHLGEAVYAPRYRKYDGNYVFDLELQFADLGSEFDKTTLLVLLTTSDFSFIQDDGESFDFNKKEEEQDDFKRAFNRSIIRNKLMIDISNGKGGFKDPLEIRDLVVNAYQS